MEAAACCCAIRCAIGCLSAGRSARFWLISIDCGAGANFLMDSVCLAVMAARLTGEYAATIGSG